MSSATAPTGFSLTGSTLHVDPANPAFAHLAQGQTMTIVVSYDIIDIHGATVTQTETVTITGTNDAPQVAAALTDTAAQGAPPHDINLLAGATDPDDGETATLSITNVKYAIDGGTPSATAPTGLSLNSATLSVDPSNAAFAHLAQGQTTTIVVSYDVIDIHGATVTQTETITITGTNDAPVIDLNGASSGVDATAIIAPDGQAHALFSNVAISDVDDGATIHSIKITWTGRGNDILTLGDCNPNIQVQYISGGLILSGNASASEYQAFLEAMTLELLGPETPSFTVVVNDGITDSAPATVTVAPPANWNFWTGNASDGNWNSPGNWSLGQVPTALETAYVSSTDPISFALSGSLALAGLIVIAGTELDLSGTGLLNITGTLVNNGTILLAPGTTLEVNGVVQNQGQLIVDNHAAGSTLLIHDHVTFTGGGTITLDGTADRITGDTFQSTLTNVDNKIDGYGRIGDGHLTLVNGIAGIIAATDFWHGITINTGQGTFTNDGLVVSASLFGGLEITGAVVNHGTLEAHLGLLKVDGAVTGQGNAVIDGGILEFRSASDAHVSFSGNTADLLKLDDVWHFTGTVTGFSFGDTIDLAGVSWRSVQLIDQGDWIQVRYGSGANDFFKIDGDYATNHFLVTTDFHGGTAITWLDQAPQIATDDVHINQHISPSGVTTTISDLSMFDTDAGRRETFSFDVTANGHTLDHGTGRLSNINDELDHGFTYTDTSPSATSTGKVAVTVTDSLGASDTVNFIFSTSTAPTTTPVALTGTAGKDVIFASSHDDTLTGGASADQFVFKTPSGHDVITDFTPGQDKIELDFVPAGSHAFQQWLASAATQQGADTLIQFDATDSLLLKHVSVSDLHAGDFILHAGIG
jgi:VCBS repeat-containing protein